MTIQQATMFAASIDQIYHVLLAMVIMLAGIFILSIVNLIKG